MRISNKKIYFYVKKSNFSVKFLSDCNIKIKYKEEIFAKKIIYMYIKFDDFPSFTIIT